MPRKSNIRAPKGSGTIRQRKDGIWEARYTDGIDPGSGKQNQHSIYGKSFDVVSQKLREITYQIDKGIFTEPARMTVKNWLDIWLKEYTSGVKENTVASYKIQIEYNICPLIGAIKLKELKPHIIQKMINTLKERLSAKSIRNVYGVLHEAMDQAVINGYIAQTPCIGIQLPRLESKKIDPLNEEEIDKFLQAIHGHSNETIFKVALFTGMREAELMGLQWQDIDFKKGIITVRQQLIHEKKKDGVYKFAPTKTSNIRKIMPAPFVMRLLKQHKKEQAKNKLMLGDKWEAKHDDLVFTTETGRNLSGTTLTHQAKRIGEKINKPGFTFHSLRHSYAVACIRAGDDLKTIQSNLGHANISITMDIYAAFTDDMAKASADRMEAYMAGKV